MEREKAKPIQFLPVEVPLRTDFESDEAYFEWAEANIDRIVANNLFALCYIMNVFVTDIQNERRKLEALKVQELIGKGGMGIIGRN